MTSFLNFFDPNRDGIVHTDSWGTLKLHFGSGGGQGPPGPQSPAVNKDLQVLTGPTGPQSAQGHK
jgi:hypothetical protein